MAHRYGSQIHSFDLLKSNTDASSILDRLQKLNTQIKYYIEDATEVSFEDHPELLHSHDAVVSQLCILHIENKGKLFENVFKFLKPGGHLYIEDFFLKEGMEFTPQESLVLEKDIGVPKGKLLLESQYKELLKESGFQLVSWRDMTKDWTQFVWKRLDDFLELESEVTSHHGEKYFKELSHFYKQMAILFGSVGDWKSDLKQAWTKYAQEILSEQEHLGGIIIVAKRI
eukprot:TRINITY_DN15622_c0_g1_i1.p1 TRINITY_DN15622_c0_g1~~TRINITY_DN15622_c0_g1_i1.p1  ORF type:complete len:228 (+),score=48.12 TRINITY_DN15622_c0_g1_i1:187-870(+)